MKTDENKEQVKSVRKTAAVDMEAGLIAALKKAAAKFGQNSKHFQKEVEKGSKRLAKKLSKEMEFEMPEEPVAQPNNKNVKEVDKPENNPKNGKVQAIPTVDAAPVVRKKTEKQKTVANSAVNNTKPA